MTKTNAAAISRKLQSVGFEKWEVTREYGFSIENDGRRVVVSAAEVTDIYNELFGFGYDVHMTSDRTEVHVYGKFAA